MGIRPIQAPSIRKRIVILANSFKHQGRCIAGRIVSVRPNGSLDVGDWVRPVSELGTGQLSEDHYRLQNGGLAKILDIVDVPCLKKQNDPVQPENWIVGMNNPWSRIGSLGVARISNLVENPQNLWLEPEGRTDRISARHVAIHPPKQSLYLLDLDECNIKRDARGGYRLHFTYNGTDYSLKITDPLFEPQFEARTVGRSEGPMKKVVVCVSLGVLYEGYHYKLVASVIQPMATRSLFTVGHSSLSIEEFIALLKQHNVEAIADVRSKPFSRRFPHFSQKPLQNALRNTGIQYVFLGKELGARRDEQETYEHGQARYERIAECVAFRDGLQRVMNGTAKYRIALMCAEKDPLACHRTILVCRHLRDFGFNISHILSNGRTETHAAAERRLMAEERISLNQMDFFDSELEGDSPIDRAYASRGDKIAFRIGEPADEDFYDRVYTEKR
ncbi:DUF488 domain-containing protein [Nitrolancea hollandica]|uniref:Dual OB-containing domain-containing protein n=1 Tax=Nitrolancea hollandica Lb TaxID=1129897 RepID=I4EKK6_9BACT|nr:DUF488 domain-containing protein [Nitrolancea hollandica]CCF85218.1 conserved hypothetical protein [Nitrolancea hollandica Lb]